MTAKDCGWAEVTPLRNCQTPQNPCGPITLPIIFNSPDSRITECLTALLRREGTTTLPTGPLSYQLFLFLFMFTFSRFCNTLWSSRIPVPEPQPSPYPPNCLISTKYHPNISKESLNSLFPFPFSLSCSPLLPSYSLILDTHDHLSLPIMALQFPQSPRTFISLLGYIRP